MKTKPFIGIFIVFIFFIMFHSYILIGLSNVNSLFKKDNRQILDKSMYESKIANLEMQLSDYDKLYNNLNIYNDNKYILARVALRDVYDFYNYLIITTDFKVNKDDYVINENGLVGVVDSANMKEAKINLLTGKINVSVKVNKSYGILDNYDRKENVFLVHNINNYENINVGDEVLSSGLTKMPANIKIGKVIKVETGGIEKILYVKSYVDFDNLNYLYVISR